MLAWQRGGEKESASLALLARSSRLPCDSHLCERCDGTYHLLHQKLSPCPVGEEGLMSTLCAGRTCPQQPDQHKAGKCINLTPAWKNRRTGFVKHGAEKVNVHPHDIGSFQGTGNGASNAHQHIPCPHLGTCCFPFKVTLEEKMPFQLCLKQG